MESEATTPSAYTPGQDYQAITPDLFRLKLFWTYSGIFKIPVTTFLVKNLSAVEDNKTSWTLVDAGFDSHVKELVIAVNKHLSLQNGILSHIVITHGHIDHIAAIPTLLSQHSCRILMHEQEKRFLVDPVVSYSDLESDNWISSLGKRFMKNSSVRVPVDIVDTIIEGDEIGGTLKAIQTPGHTPGAMSYLHESSGHIMVGDTFMNISTCGSPASCSGPLKISTPQWKQAVESMKKVFQLQKDMNLTILATHDSGNGLSINEVEAYLKLQI